MKPPLPNSDHLNVAYRIAETSLRRTWVDPHGFVAGVHHFVDLWARDSFFAAMGAYQTGLTEAARQTIDSFVRHQRSDGLVPYSILRAGTGLSKYRGKPRFLSKPKASFRSRQSFGTVPDGGLMLVIAVGEYLKQTGDRQSVSHWYDALVRALMWYDRRYGSGLVREWVQCEWADAVLKFGLVLYTNVLYLKALSDMTDIAAAVGDRDGSVAYRSSYRTLHGEFRRRFWNGRYFADWIDYRRHDYFNTGGNLLAVLYGLCRPEEADTILALVKKDCWQQFTVSSSVPKYPFWRIPIQNFLAGMGDYWNGCLWLQPGLLYAMALGVTGRRPEGRVVLTSLATKIAEYHDIFEVYDPNGTPLRRRFYIAERSFAWSSGLFIRAYHDLL